MEDPLCILCCKSYPLAHISPVDTATLDRFIQQQNEGRNVLDAGLSAEGLLSSKEASVCGECLSWVSGVMDKRGQVDEVEVQVRQLQRQILGMMRELEGLVDKYLEEMRGLERRIATGKEARLQERFPRRRGRQKKGTWSRDNVFQFRSGILSMVKELSAFGERKSSVPRLIGQDVKPNFEMDDVLTSLKQEDLDKEDNSHIDASPCPPSPLPMNSSPEEEDEGDDSADSDFIPSSGGDSKKPCLNRARKSQSVVSIEKQAEDSPPQKKKRDGGRGKHKAPRPEWYTRVTENGRELRGWYYLCTLCPHFRTKRMARLDQHLRAHETVLSSTSTTTISKFSCSFCPTSFHCEQLWQFHELCHRGIIRLTCDACPIQKKIPVFQLKEHLERDHGIQKIIPCAMCHQLHSCRRKYLLHLEHHGKTEDNPVMACDLCPESRTLKNELLQHYALEHGIHFEAEKTTEATEGKRPPWFHVEINPLTRQQKRWFTCNLCPDVHLRPSKSHYGLEEHLRHHQRQLNNKNLSCPHCPASFGVPQYLELHSLQHEGMFPYFCDQCRLSIPAHQLTDHLLNEHGLENVIPCGSCSLVCSTREFYMSHLYTCHNGPESVYLCDLCPTSPPSRRQLVDHYLEAHGLTVTDEKYTTRKHKQIGWQRQRAQERVLCPQCGQSVKAINLPLHQRNRHGTDSKAKPFVCSECGTACKTQSSLKLHQRHQHEKTEPEYQCHLCSKTFRYKNLFEGHMRGHQGTGFCCEFCGKTFGMKLNLQLHMKVHQREWLHCDKCAGKFSTTERLEQHRRKLHGGKGKEHRCGLCDKVFPLPSKLRIHVQSVHDRERAYACRFCDKNYGTPKNLQGHMRLKHPQEWSAVPKKRGNFRKKVDDSLETPKRESK